MGRVFKPVNKFTQVSNDLLCHREISFKAKGLYAYLLSKPDDYQFAYERIAWETQDGEKAISSGMQELIKFKFIYQKKNYTGKIDYYMFNNPNEFDQFFSLNSPNLPNSGMAKSSSDTPNLPNGRQAFWQTAQMADSPNGGDNKQRVNKNINLLNNKESLENLKENLNAEISIIEGLKASNPDLAKQYQSMLDKKGREAIT